MQNLTKFIGHLKIIDYCRSCKKAEDGNGGKGLSRNPLIKEKIDEIVSKIRKKEGEWEKEGF